MQINYDGWLCGNDSYPEKTRKKYSDKINIEVYGFNTLVKQIIKAESNWEYVSQEYKIDQKYNGKSLKRKAWDYFIKINGRKILVEFDGSQHYSEINRLRRDEGYQQIAEALGFEVIRIPYFIQLDTKLIEYYFHVELKNTIVEHSFLQGFRVNGRELIPEFKDTKAEKFRNTLKYKCDLQTNFNQLGLNRFESEMMDLSSHGFNEIVSEIKESLECRANDWGWPMKYAMPSIRWQ